MSKSMAEHSQTIGNILRESLAEKRKRNPSYSARALARDMKVSPAFLSMVLKGKKHLSLERAKLVSQSLGIQGRKRSHFLKAVAMVNITGNTGSEDIKKILFEPASSQDFVSMDVHRFEFLSHWYHVAVLDLANCRDFSADPKWIATRLGITPEIANHAIDRLLRLGLLVKNDGTLKKTNAEISIPTTQPHVAIRNFHNQMIEKAKEALQSQEQSDFVRREISGITMAIDPSRIEEAKKRIKQFKREMYDLLSANDANQTEVFQLNVQFFPLTKRPTGDEK